MAFGIKIKKVELSKEYTFEELIAAMKTKTDWSAGEPSLTKHGFAQVICFPPVDRQNQVWVQLMKAKGSNKVQIMLSHDIAGDFGNMAKNAVLDALTDGIAGLGAAFGKKAKTGEKMVDATVEELTQLGL